MTVVTVVTVVTIVTIVIKKTFLHQKLFSPENSFFLLKNLFTQKSTQPLNIKNHTTSSHTKSRNLFPQNITHSLKNKSSNLSAKKSRNLQKNKSGNLSERVSEKNHATSLNIKSHATSLNIKKSRNLSIHKIMATSQQSIARIAKRCPENITSFIKCVKLLFLKVQRKGKKKFKMGAYIIFLWRGCMIFLTTVTTVKKNYLLSTFENSNLTHLTTDVMFSEHRFAFLAFFNETRRGRPHW